MSTFSNRTFQGIYFTQSYQSSGAVTLTGTTNLIENCVFDDNGGRYFSTYGGAISTGEEGVEEVTIRNTTFSNNYAQHGGAIAASKKLNLVNVTFTNNHAEPYSYAGYGGAIFVQGCEELNYTVTSGNNITNLGNYGAIGGFLHDHEGHSVFTFDIEDNASLTIGSTSASTDSINLHKGSKLVKTGDGTMTINSVIERRHIYTEEGSCTDGDITVQGGILELNRGGTFDGTVKISGGQLKLGANYTFNSVEFELQEGTSLAMISNWNRLTTSSITIDVENAATGEYILAANAGNFNSAITITDNDVTQTIAKGQEVTIDGTVYSLNVVDSNLVLTADGGEEASSLVVTTAEDVVDANDGVTSLREALAYAASGNARAQDGKITITFDDDIFTDDSVTITLNSSLNIEEGIFTEEYGELVLQGTEGKNVILDGNSAVRILTVNSGNYVTIDNLTLQHGNDSDAGAIYNCGDLSINNSVVCSNRGSAVLSRSEQDTDSFEATLTIYNSLFQNNNQSGYGGALNTDTKTYIIGSTFENNSSGEGGALSLLGGADVVIDASTFIGNSASSYGGAIQLWNEHTSILNSTFTGNSDAIMMINVSWGGQISSLNLVNNIFVDNSLRHYSSRNISALLEINNLTDSNATVSNTFSEVENGDAVLDEDGTIHLQAGGSADGTGVYVWHNEDYSAIAYSETYSGEKIALLGDVADATILSTDQLGNQRSAESTTVGATLVTEGTPVTPEPSSDFDNNHSFDTAYYLGADQEIANAENAALNDTYEQDYYSFTLTQSSAVTLTTSGSDGGDTQLYLYNANQEQIAYNDDGGDGYFSKISNQTLAAGTYYVMVKAYGSGTVSNYNLTTDVTIPEAGSLVVTTGENVTDATDGVTSLAEAVAYAKELGGNQTITFNIADGDEIDFTENLTVTSGVTVDGLNIATGNYVRNKTGVIVANGGTLKNYTVFYANTDRSPGDIWMEIGSHGENLTAGEYGDFYATGCSIDGAHVEQLGELMAYNSQIQDLTIDYQGVLYYSTGNTFTGTLSIGGAVEKKVGSLNQRNQYNTPLVAVGFSGNDSQVNEDTDLIFDLQSWTPGTQTAAFAADISVSSTNHVSMLIDNMAVFTGAGSYSINVKSDQELGTYLLAGNAADFSAPVTLNIIDENIYPSFLPVGESCTVSGREYTLAVNDDDVLTLTITAVVPETSGLVVTTGEDVVDANDGVTSLREAIAYAEELCEEQTVTFHVAGTNEIEISSFDPLKSSVPLSRLNEATGKEVVFVVNDKSFSGYSSSSDGGVYGGTANLEINSSTFSSNRSSVDGGALYGEDTKGSINDSTFSGNRCNNETSGGAVAFEECDVTIDGSTFENNFALHGGGALSSWERDDELETSHLTTITNSVFRNNYVWGYGGALKIYHTDISITDTTFTGNYTGNSTYYGWGGGAIWLEGADMTYTVTDGTDIVNSGNHGTYGGFLCFGIYHHDDEVLGTTATFDVQGTGTLTIGVGNQDTTYDSFASGRNHSGAETSITKTGSGLMTINAAVSMYDGNWVVEDGTLSMVYGGDFDGEITITNGTLEFTKDYTFKTLNLDLTDHTSENAMVSGLDHLNGGLIRITVDAEQDAGSYLLANGAEDFASTVTLVVGDNTYNEALHVGETYSVNGKDYTLGLTGDGVLSLGINTGTAPTPTPVDTDDDDQLTEAHILVSTVTGAMDDKQDVDMYSFTVSEDEIISLQTAVDGDNLTVDTYLRLFDAAGNELTADDDSGVNHYSRIGYTFREAGTYYVGVSYYTNSSYDAVTGGNDRDGKTGNYQLTLSRNGYDDSDDQISEARELDWSSCAADFLASSGRIANVSDVDMYRFEVSENQIGTFTLDSSIGAYMRIFDANGSELASGNGVLEYAFQGAGTYYLGISGSDNRSYSAISGVGDTDTSITGTYDVEVELRRNVYVDDDDTLATAMRGTNDMSFTGAMDALTDADLFRFTVSANEELTFTVSGKVGGTDFDSYLRLFDANGVELTSNDDNGTDLWSTLTYRFTEAGTYYLGLSASGNKNYDPLTGEGDVNAETGDYTLTVRSRMTQTVFLSSATYLGQVTTSGPVVSSASIDRPSQVNMYSFDVNAGDKVWIDLDNLAGSSLDSYFRLFDADGTELAFNDDGAAAGESERTCESYLEYTFTTAGKYYLGISAYGSQDYEVMANAVSMTGETSGSYRLAFGLVVVDDDPDDTIDTAHELTADVAYADVLDTTTDVDMFKIDLAKGETLTATVMQNDLQYSNLRLFDENGNELASGASNAVRSLRRSNSSVKGAQITWQAEEAGTYYLGVSGYGNARYNAVDGSDDKATRYTGSYSITATVEASTIIIGDDEYEANDTMASAATLDTVSGLNSFFGLTMNDDADWYKFTVSADTGVDSSVTLVSSDAAAELSLNLYSADGAWISSATDGRDGISLAGLYAGDYYLKVTGTKTDDYGLTLNLTEAQEAAETDTAENYVVLFSGGLDLSANYTYYYDGIKRMYEIATETYNVPKDHIYVLYADGTNTSIDNPLLQNSDMSFAEGSVVLSATKANLRSVLQVMAEVTDSNDHFLFYSYDHGAKELLTQHEGLYGWQETSPIWDTQFANYISEIGAGYQTYLLAQCFSGGMLEDITIKGNMFVASSADASNVAYTNPTTQDGFSKSVEDALDSGINTTYELFDSTLQTNPYSSKNNSQKAGADFSIFATGEDTDGDTRTNEAEAAAVETGTQAESMRNSDPVNYTVNKNGNYSPVVTGLDIYEETGYDVIGSAQIGDTVALSVIAYDPDIEDDIAMVEFYYRGMDGKQQLLAVDTDGSDGWQYMWTLGTDTTTGYCSIAAVAQDNYGNYSSFYETEFRILEENFHPEITDIRLNADSYFRGQGVIVSGIAQDADKNGIDSVRIYLDTDKNGIASYPDECLGIVAVNADGSWNYTFTLDSTMEPGSYTVFAEAVDSLDMLTGDAKGVSFMLSDTDISSLEVSSNTIQWKKTSSETCVVEYSTDKFGTVLSIATKGSAVDVINLPDGEYQVRARYDEFDGGTDYQAVSQEEGTSKNATLLSSNGDGTGDVFFTRSAGLWDDQYVAQHNGIKDGWEGTKEQVVLAGKNKITDVFAGSTDANLLVLTDTENGDALFVDDIYSAFPTEQRARIAQIDEIRAGAGDDIVDMTSQLFAYEGDGVIIRGGEGNDVLWSNTGDNKLFGDAGNDRLVGASDDDLLVGGIGNDRMHGGGGDDTFCFCENWGQDTVQQLAGGSAVLWFAQGDLSNWDADTLTYVDGENKVTVTGIAAEKVTLKFGDDDSDQYDTLLAQGAFDDFSTSKIFDERGTGIIASV